MADPDRQETIGRSAVYTLLAQLSRTVFTSVLTFYLVRMLGPGGYGIYVLALGIGLIAGLFSDFGVPSSAGRLVAQRRGDSGVIVPIVSDAVRLALVLGGVVSVGVVLLAPWIANAYGEPRLLAPLRVVAIAIFAKNLFSLFTTLFLGMAKASMQALLYTLEGFCETGAAVLLVALGGGAAAAIWGQVVGFAVAAAAGLVALVGVLGRRVLPGLRSAGYTGQIASYGGTVFILVASLLLFDQIDILMLSAFLGTEAAGTFQAAMRLTFVVLLVGQAVSNAIAPRLARLREEPDVQGALTRAMQLLLAFAGGLVILLTLWAKPIVHLTLGDQYRGAVGVLRIAGPFVFFGGIGSLVTMGVTYLGDARRRLPAALGAIGAQVLLDLVLIPPLGVRGPALATDIVYGCYCLFHLWLLHRRVGLDFRALAKTMARTAVAAAGLVVVLLVAGTGTRLSASGWALGTVGGATVFLGLLFATGELRTADLSALRAALGRDSRA